jgi:hypothetical protein
MNKTIVEILTVDDNRIDPDVFDAMQLDNITTTHSKYIFQWAIASNNILVNTKDKYLKYVSYFRGNQDEMLGSFNQVEHKILLFDLRYNLVGINTDEVKNWVQSYDSDILDSRDLKEAMSGIYLCGLALQNISWKGVIMICTTVGDSEMVERYIRKIKTIFDDENSSRVSLLFRNRGMARGIGGTANHINSNQRTLNEGIEEFISKEGDIKRLIWTKKNEKWFSRTESSCPECQHHLSSKNQNIIKETFKGYLSELFNCKLPEEWFIYDALYKCHNNLYQLHANLKCLVGEFSKVHNGEAYSMTLGCMLLILATVQRDISSTQKWLQNITWQDCTSISVSIGQNNDRNANYQLRDCLISLSELLKENKYTEEPLIQDVSLNAETFTIYLNHDFSNQPEPGKKSLIEMINSNNNDGCGDLCRTLRDLQNLLGTDKVRFYVDESATTILEIRAT